MGLVEALWYLNLMVCSVASNLLCSNAPEERIGILRKTLDLLVIWGNFILYAPYDFRESSTLPAPENFHLKRLEADSSILQIIKWKSPFHQK